MLEFCDSACPDLDNVCRFGRCVQNKQSGTEMINFCRFCSAVLLLLWHWVVWGRWNTVLLHLQCCSVTRTQVHCWRSFEIQSPFTTSLNWISECIQKSKKKQGRTAMPLIILEWKNWLEKVRKICAEFAKMVLRICKVRTTHALCSVFGRRILNP